MIKEISQNIILKQLLKSSHRTSFIKYDPELFSIKKLLHF